MSAGGMAVAGLLAGAAVWVVAAPRPAMRRLTALMANAPGAVPPDGEATTRPRAAFAVGPRLSAAAGRRVAAVLAGAAVAALINELVGLVLGGVVGIGLNAVLARVEPADVRRRRERLAADLPLAADLLAACLRSGRSVDGALADVADALGGPLGAELAAVARALRLGADSSTAWEAFDAEPLLAPMGRAITRSVESGAPLARTLDRIGDDARRARRGAAQERARAVGVKAAAPLGLCFLPAFLMVGVVPVVMSAFLGILT